MSDHNPGCQGQSYRSLSSLNDNKVNRPDYASAGGIIGANPDIRRKIQRDCFGAVDSIESVFYSHALKRHIKLERIHDFVEVLINQLPANEDIFISMTSLQSSGDYLFQHSVNVSILSVALGFRLGLTNDQLAELAFTALFHDFGKSAIFSDNQSDCAKKNREELEIMEAHTVLGAKYIACNFKLDRFSSHAAIVAFEHHKNCDGSGFPFINKKREMGLYSKIVAICNFYDELTTGMAAKKASIPVDQVLLKMIRQSQAKFDPYLMKSFFHLVGMYPIGTLLLLDSNELALVIQINPDNLFRPSVLIIADENGRKNPFTIAGLSAFDKSNNRYFRDILHIVDPLKYGINVSEFLLLD